jgi:hypothetical protein
VGISQYAYFSTTCSRLKNCVEEFGPLSVYKKVPETIMFSSPKSVCIELPDNNNAQLRNELESMAPWTPARIERLSDLQNFCSESSAAPHDF